MQCLGVVLHLKHLAYLVIDDRGQTGQVGGGSGGVEGGPGTDVGADAGELGGDLGLGGGDHVEELLLRGVQAGDVGDHGSRVLQCNNQFTDGYKVSSNTIKWFDPLQVESLMLGQLINTKSSYLKSPT